jgi:hypothetical protein
MPIAFEPSLFLLCTPPPSPPHTTPRPVPAPPYADTRPPPVHQVLADACEDAPSRSHFGRGAQVSGRAPGWLALRLKFRVRAEHLAGHLYTQARLQRGPLSPAALLLPPRHQRIQMHRLPRLNWPYLNPGLCHNSDLVSTPVPTSSTSMFDV